MRAYHERTKHRLDGYARGPETIDWSSPPDPFRRFDGAPRVELPLCADRYDVPFNQMGVVQRPAATLTLEAIGALFELSFAISAWKEYGPDRWALRCNPSSGNLHPTEAYLIARGVPGLADGLYHYDPGEHALEMRCAYAPGPAAGVFVGLSSLHWREAWKYGERALRYCLLDIGHAIGALRYAAACLGWSACCIPKASSAEIAARLGLDRAADFEGVEREDPQLIVAVGPALELAAALPPLDAALGRWSGRANRIDPHPMYRWPVIAEAAHASDSPASSGRADANDADSGAAGPLRATLPSPCTAGAATLIRRRRSAQHFAQKHVMSADALWRMLDALAPEAGLPWDVWRKAPRLHAILFVHRVDGLVPGVYALPRSGAGETLLRSALDRQFAWAEVDGCPSHVPLYRLLEAPSHFVARRLSCGQAIASDCCVAWALLGEFDAALTQGAWHYRTLHWEAGLLGQVLYLEAEAAGLRGTGIGCFFDDATHQALGINGTQLQTIYHFSVGLPLVDQRIRSLPPYPRAAASPNSMEPIP